MTVAPTIFVLIASYRDTECQWTVRDLFDKATNPERIRVGICWQADPEQDRKCFEIETRPAQVDAVYFFPAESRGVCWARAQAQALLRDEDYALQIDSHMRFVQGWDQQMVSMLSQCDSPKPLLTVYPPGYTPPDQLDLNPSPRVQCATRFNSNGALFYSARSLPDGVQAKSPMATAGLAAGFIFGAAQWLRAVAHDPDIYFNGEEHALAARLWTHGFDLFSPHQTVIYHYYLRKESPRPWTDDPKWWEKSNKTRTRLRQLLTPTTLPQRDREDMGIYGLGSARSLAEYEAYAGINFAARSIAPFAKSFPYVRSEDVAATLLTDHRLAVSAKAALFIVDDQGLLFSAARGEIYQLNTAATYVWCQLEDGANWDELVKGLCSFCGMTAADAENALTNLVVHWRGQGVLQGNDTEDSDQELAPPREDAPEASDEGTVASPPRATVLREQHYRLLDSCFCVQFCDSAQLDWLMPTLTHLEVGMDQPAGHVITICAEGDKHHIFKDGELVHTGKLISQLAPLLKFQLVRTALDQYDHILNLHAGVVAKNGAVIALPAQSGDGKSTLVAGLLGRGYQYFSDEVAPLARNSCQVVSVPIGICIKDSAFPTLQSWYPEILQQPVHDREDGRRAIYLPPPMASIAQGDKPSQISHIVFPKYREGATTSLTPVPRVEAFARVLEQCVSIPKPLSLADAGALVHWIEQVHCYDLVSGSLEASMDQIDSLVDQYLPG